MALVHFHSQSNDLVIPLIRSSERGLDINVRPDLISVLQIIFQSPVCSNNLELDGHTIYQIFTKFIPEFYAADRGKHHDIVDV